MITYTGTLRNVSKVLHTTTSLNTSDIWIVVPHSPGGVAYKREVIPPDWVVDYWHPLEKAQYPEYFARREQRKKEFVKLWEQQYGKSTAGHH